MGGKGLCEGVVWGMLCNMYASMCMSYGHSHRHVCCVFNPPHPPHPNTQFQALHKEYEQLYPAYTELQQRVHALKHALQVLRQAADASKSDAER